MNRISYTFISLCILFTSVQCTTSNAPELFSKAEDLQKDSLFEEANKYYKQAAEMGYPEAQTALGQNLNLGNGCERDTAQALFWWRKAAEQNNAQAFYELGNFIFNPMERTDSTDEIVLNYWLKAAKMDCSDAQRDLGALYNEGSIIIYPDEERRDYWRTKAFRKTNEDPWSIEIDEEERLAFEKAFQKAQTGNADTWFDLGHLYLCGTGTDINITEGDKWLKKAFEQYSIDAKKGDTHAQYMLGRSYLFGYGCKEDTTQVISWSEKAAKQGNVDAMAILGHMYMEDKDYSKALPWVKKGAENGHKIMQYFYGLCLYNGYGGKKDEDEALLWMKKARTQGESMAFNFLYSIENPI